MKQKTPKLLVIIILLLISQFSFSQKEIKFREYKKMSRDSILKLAVDIVDPGILDGADLLKHKYTAVKICGRSVLVYFKNPVVFLSENESLISAIEVDVTKRRYNYDYQSFNRFQIDINKDLKFYIETEYKKKHLEFVLKIIDEKRNLTVFDFYYIDNNLIIREHEDRYDVHNYSSSDDSYFSIVKEIGKIENPYSTYNLGPVYEDNCNCREIK